MSTACISECTDIYTSSFYCTVEALNICAQTLTVTSHLSACVQGMVT